MHLAALPAAVDVSVYVLDKQALSAYRRRLAEIDADLDEARSWADTGRAAKLAAGKAPGCWKPIPWPGRAAAFGERPLPRPAAW